VIPTLSRILKSIRARTRAKQRSVIPVPALAPGAELLGQYKDSGLREAPWIVRRADGRVIQLTRLLYVVAESLEGADGLDEVARRVGSAIDRIVTADNIVFLVENKLRPLGLLAGGDAAAPSAEAAAPLQLTMRARLVPARTVDALARLFQPLFAGSVVGAALALLVVGDVWLFGSHGLGGAFRQLILRPELALVVFALVVASVLFHELGHASACRYGGARPGVIGVGLYLIYPAFYTDVTDAYRLGRAGRIRTDLGGIYFNGLFVLGLFAVYAKTGFEPLLAVVAIEHLLVLNQFWPWLRLDGYYVLNDLTGVPDVLSRVRPVLRSIVPGRDADPRASELKPWVRVVLTTYSLVLVPTLFVLLVLVAWATPRLVSTAWSSFLVERIVCERALAAGDLGAAAIAAARALLVALPACGVLLGLSRMALRLLDATVARFGLRPSVRTAAVFAAGIACAIALTPTSHGEAAAPRPDDRDQPHGVTPSHPAARRGPMAPAGSTIAARSSDASTVPAPSTPAVRSAAMSPAMSTASRGARPTVANTGATTLSTAARTSTSTPSASSTVVTTPPSATDTAPPTPTTTPTTTDTPPTTTDTTPTTTTTTTDTLPMTTTTPTTGG
jgi:putative peptide zinc metalloprotease protein